MIFILNVASNPKSLVKLENRVLDRLGRISYGIYMYHVLVISVIMVLLMKILPVQTGTDFGYNLFLYGASIALTLLVAHFSYEYFEKFFLRLKPRFSLVQSTDQAEDVRVAEASSAR